MKDYFTQSCPLSPSRIEMGVHRWHSLSAHVYLHQAATLRGNHFFKRFAVIYDIKHDKIIFAKNCVIIAMKSGKISLVRIAMGESSRHELWTDDIQNIHHDCMLTEGHIDFLFNKDC